MGLSLRDLGRTKNGRFKIPKEWKDLVLPKYPKPKNADKQTFSCSRKQLFELVKGKYQYILYCDGKTAYLFEASEFKPGLTAVDYNVRGHYQQFTTYVGYVGSLIRKKLYVDILNLIPQEVTDAPSPI